MTIFGEGLRLGMLEAHDLAFLVLVGLVAALGFSLGCRSHRSLARRQREHAQFLAHLDTRLSQALEDLGQRVRELTPGQLERRERRRASLLRELLSYSRSLGSQWETVEHTGRVGPAGPPSEQEGKR